MHIMLVFEAKHGDSGAPTVEQSKEASAESSSCLIVPQRHSISVAF